MIKKSLEEELIDSLTSYKVNGHRIKAIHLNAVKEPIRESMNIMFRYASNASFDIDQEQIVIKNPEYKTIRIRVAGNDKKVKGITATIQVEGEETKIVLMYYIRKVYPKIPISIPVELEISLESMKFTGLNAHISAFELYNRWMVG